jgi:hypothetical protein
MSTSSWLKAGLEIFSASRYGKAKLRIARIKSESHMKSQSLERGKLCLKQWKNHTMTIDEVVAEVSKNGQRGVDSFVRYRPDA